MNKDAHFSVAEYPDGTIAIDTFPCFNGMAIVVHEEREDGRKIVFSQAFSYGDSLSPYESLESLENDVIKMATRLSCAIELFSNVDDATNYLISIGGFSISMN